MMKLFDYFRSSASYRVRIALALKGVEADIEEVHLVNHGGEHNQPAYLQYNPQGLVPTLIVNKDSLSQSLAILDYLEQIYPQPSLFPIDHSDRAHAYSIALSIACDIHPLNNLRVLNYLKENYLVNSEQVQSWYHHWLKLGFDAIEENLNKYQKYDNVCIGEHVSIADICLIPQVYNAIRFEFPLQNYPRIEEIYEACMNLSYFDKTKP